MPIEIIPAVLPKSFDDLTEHLSLVRGLCRTVQIDVVDGQFAPNKTWPFLERESFERIRLQEETMPWWEEFDFEIDLMVNDSKIASQEWVEAGASRVLIHVESPDDRGALMALQPLRDTYGPHVEVGLAISFTTPLEKLETLAELGTSIQLMGIGQIGFQGSTLEDGIYERIRQVKAKYPEHTIAVDGGVTLENAPRLLEAGAQRLVVGSHIFEGDVAENIAAFKALGA